MLRFFRFWCLCCFALASSAWAQASAPAPVEWSVQVTGDTLNIEAKTAAPAPTQRLNGSPSFLELTFPKTKMASSALNKAVDRGLVQKVQTIQDGQGTSVRVFVMSKPKATLTKTADGYRYSIRMSEPAASATASSKPAKPVANTSAGKPSPWAIKNNPETSPAPPVAQPQTPVAQPQPPVAQPQTPVAQPQTPVAQPQPPVAQPQTPVAQPQPPVAQPQPPVAQPQPPVASTAPSGRDARQPITVVFQNKPIGEALAELARQAGYTAQIDPTLSGAVNLSLSDVPFEDALGLLLEPYGSSVTSSIGAQSITVRRVAAAAPATPSASTTSDVVLEYYPFSNKDAQKMMDAVSKAVPELTYQVDPALNVLLVQGPREHVLRLGELLKKMSSK